jgi:homopolymeric O-antigen transport system permease protein
MRNPAQDEFIYDSALRKHPAIDEFWEVIHYRDLVLQLVRRDVLTRYKRSVLGVAWTLINPLGMMIVLTLVFSQVFKFGGSQDYPVFVLSGLLAWTFFSQTSTAAMVNLVWGGGLLNRIYVPRSSFALAAIGTGLVNIVLSLIPLLLVMLVTGIPVHLSFLFLPVPILLLAAFSLGLGLLLSTVAVYFPDVKEMYQIVLTAWMYLTPIIYPKEVLPEAYRAVITALNPMYHLVELFRIPILPGRFPTIEEILPALIISLVTLAAGWWVFSQKADEIAYRI